MLKLIPKIRQETLGICRAANLLKMGGYYATASLKIHICVPAPLSYLIIPPAVLKMRILCEKMALPFRAYCLWYTSGISIIRGQDRTRAGARQTRGWEFGQSRVICGAHWQSDVDAGRYVEQ